MSKIQHLQRNFNELSVREAKLSHEKLELCKERMELQAMRKKLFQTRCSLCKIGEKSKEISDMLTNTDGQDVESIFQNTNHISPDRFLLLNELDRKMMDEINEPQIDGLLDTQMTQMTSALNRLKRFGRSFEIDLAGVPDITDISDNLLDPDLQLVKLEALNAKHF